MNFLEVVTTGDNVLSTRCGLCLPSDSKKCGDVEALRAFSSSLTEPLSIRIKSLYRLHTSTLARLARPQAAFNVGGDCGAISTLLPVFRGIRP